MWQLFKIKSTFPANIRLDEDVFKTSSRRLDEDVFKTSSRHLQDLFKTFSKRLQDVFKTSCKDLFKMFSKRIVNTFLKNVSESYCKDGYLQKDLPKSHLWEIYGQRTNFQELQKFLKF